MVATMTTQSGARPLTRHLMLQNFSMLCSMVDYIASNRRGSRTSAPDVCTEAGFGHNVASVFSRLIFGQTSELESDEIGEDRRVTMGDVGERSSVDEDRRALGVASIRLKRQKRKRYRTSSVCMRFGLIASFMRIASEPVTPISSAVIGTPALLFATTILPKLCVL